MSDQLTANFSGKGFQKNFLELMAMREQFKKCCLSWLTQVYTQNSDTVIFSGLGTLESPLTAIAIGSAPPPSGITSVTNGLSQITPGVAGLGGPLTQDTTIENGNFALTFTGIQETGDGTASLIISASNDGFMQMLGSDHTSLIATIISNSKAGGGAAAGAVYINDVNHVQTVSVTSSTYTAGNLPSDAAANYSNSSNGFYYSSFGGGGFVWSNQEGITGIDMVLNAAGHLIIGGGPTLTPTDTGAKLQVVGSINLSTITLPVTPVSGNLETDGTNLYFTVGGVRKTVTLS